MLHFLLEPKSHRHNPLHQMNKSILKPMIPPTTKPLPTLPPTSTSKIALIPPTKQALTPPPLPPPKPIAKPLPPLPPPKPPGLTSLSDPELQNVNGLQDLPSPLRSPDSGDTVGKDGEAAPDGELEVGSMVEVNDPPLFGVVRWIGRIGGIPEQVAGIELVRQKLGFVALILYIFYINKNPCCRTRKFLRGQMAVTSGSVISVARPTKGCLSSFGIAGEIPGFLPQRHLLIKWNDATLLVGKFCSLAVSPELFDTKCLCICVKK